MMFLAEKLPLTLPYAIAFLAFYAVILVVVFKTQKRKPALVREWVASQGCRLVEYEERPFSRGPYQWSSGWVFRVVVEYPDGRIAIAWLRRLFNDLEVKWDPDDPTSARIARTIARRHRTDGTLSSEQEPGG